MLFSPEMYSILYSERTRSTKHTGNICEMLFDVHIATQNGIVFSVGGVHMVVFFREMQWAFGLNIDYASVCIAAMVLVLVLVVVVNYGSN